MDYKVSSKGREMCIVVNVSVVMPAKIRIRVFDSQKQKIIFSDRYKTVQSKETFYIRLPMTSNEMIMSVFDDNAGNLHESRQPNIKIEYGIIPLQKRIDLIDIKNPDVVAFIDFAQRFAFNCQYMETGKTYRSDMGGMTIEYLDTIRNSAGRELTTPARISKVTGGMQMSKKQIQGFTVPMVFAILCHEFSHFFLNDNMNDETEADINGLLIYLGLGYPRIEAYQAFLEVFMDSPNDKNKERYKIINQFISDFDSKKLLF